MARIFPFQPYRYSLKAGPIEKLVTQPYDKISPEMQTRYLAQNPNNLVRVILGERLPSDNEQQNVYTRAAGYLTDWIASGILAQEAEPSLYAYFQEFSVPDTGEKLNRKGFIGVGAVEDYSENVVHRHEQTLSGPKKDRMELLKHTHAHFGQIFMLYPDPKGEIDQILDEAAKSAPLGKIVDEYGATHTFYKISDPARVAKIQFHNVLAEELRTDYAGRRASAGGAEQSGQIGHGGLFDLQRHIADAERDVARAALV